jgi:hypothetical protein
VIELDLVDPGRQAPSKGGWTRALQAIVAGRRDRTLADPPDLHYTMAAEILFVIEPLFTLIFLPQFSCPPPRPPVVSP